MADVFHFPTYNVSLGDAIVIVKRCLNDDGVELESKLLAIEKVTNMETHNSITKDDLIKSLRWLFEHYDFQGSEGQWLNT